MNAALPSIGQLIEVTDRRSAGRRSPLLQVGRKFVVAGHDTLRDGSPVIVLQHPTRARRTLRMNTALYQWREVSLQQLHDRRRAHEVNATTEQLLLTLSRKQQTEIVFVPLVMARLAWNYAERALALAAAHKVGLLKKLSRATREAAAAYDVMLRRTIQPSQLHTIRRDTERFEQEQAPFFTTLYFTVNNEVKRAAPEFGYDDIRTQALTAVLIVDMMDDYYRHINELLRVALRRDDLLAVSMPTLLRSLRTGMVAMAGLEGRFRHDAPDIRTALAVLRNKLVTSEFDVIFN